MVQQTQKRGVNVKTILVYSALFAMLAIIIYTPFYFQNRSFIWEGDGYHQHYPFFREYLNILRHFLSTGEWQSWDWSIGLGADTLMTYGYYVVGDPFVYLGLFFPAGAEEFAFHALMFMRIWFVGASFLLFARSMKFSHQSALIGSILYTFSHYVIYNVVRHPFFIHPLIFFPSLCLGVEKIYRKESGVLFALMVAFSAISNFYFFYMLTWMVFLYALLRYRSAVKIHTWKTFFSWVGYFTLLYIIGLLLSALIFFPQVYGVLNASRSTGLPPISLFFYPLRYYGLLIVNALTPGTIFWAVGGFSIFGMLSLVFLVKRSHEQPELFWAFLIVGVLLLFPFFGSFMNGLSGPYNRFTFVLPFYFALAVNFFLENQHDLSERDAVNMRWLLGFFSVLYAVVSVVTGDYFFYLTPVLLGWLTYALVNARMEQEFPDSTFNRLMLVAVAVNLTLNALNFYLPYGKFAVRETIEYGTIDESYENVFGQMEKELPKDEWYRISVSARDNHVRNQYAYLDVFGTNSYASLTNGYVADFADFIETSQYQIIQPLRNGIDDRRIANQALGVRYVLTEKQNAAYISPGYEIANGEILVAETKNQAPFAYLEPTTISRKKAERLHPVQRESLLAEGVIVEGEGTNEITPALNYHFGTWEFGKGIEGDDDFSLGEAVEFTVLDEENEMTLLFENPKDLVGQEVFISFEGVDYETEGNSLLTENAARFRMRIRYNGQEKGFLQSDTYSFSSYFKRDDVLVHLNLVKDPQDRLTIRFDDTGHYRFEKINVVSRPYDEEAAVEFARMRQKRAMEVTEFGHTKVTGKIEADEDGIVVTSIPFSKGWQAFVDGEIVPIERVNIGFIGIRIAAGSHNIEFSYRTPYLRMGAFISVLGLLALSSYLLLYRKRKNSP